MNQIKLKKKNLTSGVGASTKSSNRSQDADNKTGDSGVCSRGGTMSEDSSTNVCNSMNSNNNNARGGAGLLKTSNLDAQPVGRAMSSGEDSSAESEECTSNANVAVQPSEENRDPPPMTVPAACNTSVNETRPMEETLPVDTMAVSGDIFLFLAFFYSLIRLDI